MLNIGKEIQPIKHKNVCIFFIKMLLYFSNTKDTGDIQKGMSFLNIYIRPKVYKHPANPNIFDIFSTDGHIKLSNY